MLSKLALFASVAVLAVATPTTKRNESASQCVTAPIECCESTSTAKDPSTAALLATLGVVVQNVDALVGLTCSPATVGAGGGTSCASNPLCCESVLSDGVVGLGCVPLNLNL